MENHLHGKSNHSQEIHFACLLKNYTYVDNFLSTNKYYQQYGPDSGNEFHYQLYRTYYKYSEIGKKPNLNPEHIGYLITSNTLHL
jgi:hypothetical protein